MARGKKGTGTPAINANRASTANEVGTPQGTQTKPYFDDSRNCPVCSHPERYAIEVALVRHGGDADRVFRQVKFTGSGLHGSVNFTGLEDFTRTKVQKHWAECMPRDRSSAYDVAAYVMASTPPGLAESHTFARVRYIEGRVVRLLDQAEAAGDLKAAASLLQHLTRCADLAGKLTKELREDAAKVQQGPGVVVIASPQLAGTGQQTAIAAAPQESTGVTAVEFVDWQAEPAASAPKP